MSESIHLRALEQALMEKLAELSGQNVNKCMQCGTCSAVCPMSDNMEITPRQAMLLLQHGLTEPLLASRTPWLCASCHACQVRCPRGIEVTRVIEAARQMVLRENEDRLDPRSIPAETLSEAPQIAFVAGLRKLTS